MTEARLDKGAMQVVMLGLGEEILAVDTGLVREIIDPVPATRVAGAQPHLASLINVRGNVIPLADIRARFGIDLRPPSADTRIVVLELAIEGEPVLIGLLADKVHEVAEIAAADALPVPRVGVRWNPDFIRCLSRWNDRFVIVPDLERVLN